MGALLSHIISDCDRYLRVADIQDWKGARNGLQVQNQGVIRRVVSAVDCNLLTIKHAVATKADLMIVHHGLFWSDIAPLTGANYEKVRLALDHNLAIYSSHLPLDMHPKIGNNILMMNALGVSKVKPFFFENGAFVGVRTEVDWTRRELEKRLKKLFGDHFQIISAGPERIRHLGVVTGAAGNELAIAVREGVDTFITGEGAHWTFGAAHDHRINLVYCGHYATETFGVRALGERLAKKFGLKHQFIDEPSGL